MNSQQLDLPPPSDWQGFQVICHALWGLEWNCPNIQENGRGGQKQRGVDIFGQPNGGERYHGIQCKVKSTSTAGNPELTEAEVQAEVDQAKKFTPGLEHLIIATTAPRDAKIQTFARQLTVEHTKIGLFKVDVLAWPEIVARLTRHQHLLERFYPGSSASWKQMAGQVASTDAKLDQLLTIAGRLDADRTGIADVINAQIDRCREMMDGNQPLTAIRMLEALERDHAAQLNDRARFRIATNIGAAKLQLNDRGAAEHFITAWGYAKGDEKADANYAYALLLQGKVAEARAAAQDATPRHPKSGRPIAVLIACAIEDRSMDDPLQLVPGDLLDNPEVMFALAGAYRFLKRGQEAVEWAEKVYARDPSLKNRRLRAESLLTKLDTPAVTLGRQISLERRRELETARKDLETCWAAIRDTEAASGDPALAVIRSNRPSPSSRPICASTPSDPSKAYGRASATSSPTSAPPNAGISSEMPVTRNSNREPL